MIRLSLFFACFIGTTVAWAGPGFFRPDDGSIPKPVHDASQSVLRGFIFAGEPKINVTEEQYGEVIQYLENLKIESGDPVERAYGVIQAGLVKLCAIRKQPTCRTGFAKMGMGSFFLIENSNTLVTARHVIERGLPKSDDLTQDYCNAYKQSVMLLLLNQEGAVLYDSVNGPDSNKVSTIGDSHLIRASDSMQELTALGGSLRDYADYELNDFAVLELSNALPLSPLKWANENESPSKYFALGYPGITQGRATLDKADADGKSIYVTIGSVAPRKFPSDISINGELPENFDLLFSQYIEGLDSLMLRIDADGNHGMSGGPIVDEMGKVLGVVTEGHTGGDSLGTSVPEQLWAVRYSTVRAIRNTVAENLGSICK